VTMHFTRARDLLVAVVIGFGLTFPLFRLAFGSLPSLPTLAGVTLLVLALGETVLAFAIRSRIKERRVESGIGIARAVVLAKASSLLGALMVGAWLGALAYLAPRSGEIVAAANDLPATVIDRLAHTGNRSKYRKGLGRITGRYGVGHDWRG
jgi:hypothetical protein